MASKIINREDFEAWIELTEGKLSRRPSYSDCKIEVSGKLDEAKWHFKASALDNREDGLYYGRAEAWNCIKVSTWVYDNWSATGKGSRSEKMEKFQTEMFELLTG